MPGYHDDEDFVRNTLRQIEWPQPSALLKRRILAMATDSTAEDMLPVSASPAYLPVAATSFRGSTLFFSGLLLSFLLGLMVGMNSISVTHKSNPLYANNGTIIMAELLK